MENKSVQDILDVDVEAIAERGKKSKKRKSRILLTIGIVSGLVILSAISFKIWDTQTKNIRAVESAIENIEIENLSSITYARKLYNALDSGMKKRISNVDKLLEAEENITNIYNEIVQAWKYPMNMGGVSKIKKILENLDDLTKDTLQEMLLESNIRPRNEVLDIFEN